MFGSQGLCLGSAHLRSQFAADGISYRSLPQVVCDHVQRPVAWHAFQGVDTTALEADTRAGDEILHGARYEDVTRRGLCGDPRTDVHRYSADLRAEQLALARMEPDAKLDANRPHRVADPPRASDRARRTVEGCEHSVSS